RPRGRTCPPGTRRCAAACPRTRGWAPRRTRAKERAPSSSAGRRAGRGADRGIDTAGPTQQRRGAAVRPMSSSAFITCAVGGAGDSTGVSDKVPVTPEQIAASALEAAEAGAAVVHIHVRDPETGKGGRAPSWFREVVERLRASSTDVVINLTTGMGGDLVLG